MKKYTKSGKRTKAFEKKVSDAWANFDWGKAFKKSSEYVSKKNKIKFI